MISCYFLYFYLICSDIDCVMVRSQYFSSPCLAWPGLLIIRRISVPSGMSCLSEQQPLHGPVFVSCLVQISVSLVPGSHGVLISDSAVFVAK